MDRIADTHGARKADNRFERRSAADVLAHR
jgi:hypothetical protein